MRMLRADEDVAANVSAAAERRRLFMPRLVDPLLHCFPTPAPGSHMGSPVICSRVPFGVPLWMSF